MTRKVSTIMQGGFYGICAALVAAFFMWVTAQPQVINSADAQAAKSAFIQ